MTKSYAHLFNGLSPLARGTLHMLPRSGQHPRFIPAGAGNSGTGPANREKYSVYPRWRGELTNDAPKPRFLHGLSPLARGTRPFPGSAAPPPRFIPAGAGNSSVSHSVMPLFTVYPRWRGELFSFTLGNAVIYGLSPLARGTPRGQPPPLTRHRFIPAGAGNSLKVYICS